MRRIGKLALDDLLNVAQPLLPHLRRASLHRLLVRHGCNRLHRQEQQSTGQTGTFKEYGPGYLHLDCFYLPTLEGKKHYCFVAIDRATRLVFLWVYEHKDKETACDFLKRCLAFYPFKIQKILTGHPMGRMDGSSPWPAFVTVGAPKPKTSILSHSYARPVASNIAKHDLILLKLMGWLSGPMV